MSEHIVTGTTEEEREKEIYDYAIKHGWNERRARVYAVVLGTNWLPELEQNYIEWFNHMPLSNICVGEITLNSLFRFWHNKDLITAVMFLWDYKNDNYESPDLVYLCGLHDEIF